MASDLCGCDTQRTVTPRFERRHRSRLPFRRRFFVPYEIRPNPRSAPHTETSHPLRDFEMPSLPVDNRDGPRGETKCNHSTSATAWLSASVCAPDLALQLGASPWDGTDIHRATKSERSRPGKHPACCPVPRWWRPHHPHLPWKRTSWTLDPRIRS